MVTLRDIRKQFSNYSHHEQIGSKQLFVCSQPSDPATPAKILVSYRTVVGVQILFGWTLTRHKYSQTTSKQLNTFARGKCVIWQDAEINLE